MGEEQRENNYGYFHPPTKLGKEKILFIQDYRAFRGPSTADIKGQWRVSYPPCHNSNFFLLIKLFIYFKLKEKIDIGGVTNALVLKIKFCSPCQTFVVYNIFSPSNFLAVSTAFLKHSRDLSNFFSHWITCTMIICNIPEVNQEFGNHITK